jgi:Rv0078B-related antitoxin
LAVLISDTSSLAQTVQLEIQRAMTGERRLLAAFEMSLFARELSKQRIRREHPEWSETQVARKLVRLAFLPGPMPARLR